jgi:hypothetical protein
MQTREVNLQSLKWFQLGLIGHTPGTLSQLLFRHVLLTRMRSHVQKALITLVAIAAIEVFNTIQVQRLLRRQRLIPRPSIH